MPVVERVFRVIELERCCRHETHERDDLSPSLSAYLLELQQLIRRADVQLHQHRMSDLVITLVESAACAAACMERHGSPARRRGQGEPEWLGEATGLDTDMVYAIIEEECDYLTLHRPALVLDLPTVLLELNRCVGGAASGIERGTAPAGTAPWGGPAQRALESLATVRFVAALTVLALASCGVDGPRPPSLPETAP